MKEIIRNFRIAFASIFLFIGNKIDVSDAEDLRAKMRRLDPSYERCGEPQTEDNLKTKSHA